MCKLRVSIVMSGRAGVLVQMPPPPPNNMGPFPSSERTVSSSQNYEAWIAVLCCDRLAAAKSEEWRKMPHLIYLTYFG